MAEDRMLNDEILLGLIKANSGGGGTTDYDALSNKPQIAGTTLSGNKSLADLGIASATDLAAKQDALTAGDYIQFDGNEISVNRNIEVDNVDYNIEYRTNNSASITKSKDGQVISTQNYDWGIYETSIDGLFNFGGASSSIGFVWRITLIKDSTTHSAGYSVDFKTNDTTMDVIESFPEQDVSGYKLVIKSEMDTALAGKQNTLTFDNVPTENSNNPVKSGGVKSAIDAAVASAYHHAGTKTCAELVAGLLVAANEGNVYNMTDSGTTTADFIEGAGQPIKAGDNVGVAKISAGVYKFDLLSGFVDTTNFVQKSQTAGLLKNDGTVDTTIQGDVVSLKSGLTTLDNEVNGDATVYPYADVITIPDAVPANVADCSVKVEPVQDLHGYDKPWSGGAWKNKLPMTVDVIKAVNTTGTWSGNVYSENGATITILTDSDNNVAGIKAEAPNTPSDTVQFNLCYKGTGSNFNDIENTSVTMNGCPSGGSENTYYIQFYKYDGTLQVKDTGSGVTFTPSNIPADARVRISIKSAIPSGGVIFYPMIRLSTETDATFAPYTNICPISGHTEASVQRDGENLWDGNYAGIATSIKYTAINVGDGSFTLDTTAPRYDDSGCPVFLLAGNVSSGVNNDDHGAYNGSPRTQISVNGYVTIAYRIVGDIDPRNYVTHLLKDSDKQTYTLALGNTIYGGTVDFDSGVMTVTHGFVADLSTLSWTYLSEWGSWYAALSGIKRPASSTIKANVLAEKYETITVAEAVIAAGSIGVGVSDSNDRIIVKNGSSTTEPSGGFCYELATPLTVQLTPQQIQLLKGQNTLYASTGQISVTVNGVSGSIGSVQEQANATDAALAEKLPTAPTTDGAYVLTVTVTSGTPTYSWESNS